MKRRRLFSLLAAACCILAFSGCSDAQKYLEKMDLSRDQISKVRPIIEDYLKKQDKIFELLKSEEPANNPDRFPGQGGMGKPSQSGSRPDESEMKKEMDKQRILINAKFEVNDDSAAEKLKSILTDEQIEQFKQIALELRREKMKEIIESHKPPQGGPGGGMGPQ